jgi:iron complex transport system substrate-binding protein
LVEGFHDPDLGNGWQVTESLDLLYAKRFTVDTFEGGYRLLCLADGNRYLVVPDGMPVPQGISEDIVVLQQPIGDVYLAASDTMCLFDALGSLDAITVSGIERDDWSIASAREAMDAGTIVYGGKYRAPDYELLISRGVRLAVESTMINHTPEVREKLMELGIPVLVELSSYESEPLARAEWVRLYGVLLGKEQQATEAFERQVDQVSSLGEESTGKTVAFFYLNSNGAAVVRRPGDYVTKMIAQAGGTYAFDDLDAAKTGSSSMTVQMETFYATAKDADVLIYNSSIDGGVTTMDDLLSKNELFADFKAVQTGDVWVTEQDMYQQMLEAGTIISDMHRAFLGQDEGLVYLRRLT